MSGSSEYTVRPLSRAASTDFKHAFRIYLSPTACLLHKLNAGDLCRVRKLGKDVGDAVVWPAPEKIQDHIVQTSKPLQKAYGLSLGDKISISKLDGEVKAVETMKVRLVNGPPDEPSPDGEEEASGWEFYIRRLLGRTTTIAKGTIIDTVGLSGGTWSFEIVSLGGDQTLGTFDKSSNVKIVRPNENERPPKESLQITRDGLGGLARPIEELNEILGIRSDPVAIGLFARHRAGDDGGALNLLTPPTNVIFHGPRGTGKSLLLEKIAASGWGKVFRVGGSATAKVMEKTFVEAIAGERSIILLDQLEVWASKTGDVKLAGALSNELDALARMSPSSRVLVFAATNRLNDLPDMLRGGRSFHFEIEVPIPDTPARTEILKCLTKLPREVDDPLIETFGARTHGYTGSDLRSLLYNALAAASRRRKQVKALPNGNIATTTKPENHESPHDANRRVTDSHGLIEADLEYALLRTRPSAMREIALEVPKVKWTDIGGQEQVKKTLREAVEWPLKYAERMREQGVEPKKGLLLYGPPGCSKTLTAKALATEAGFNFIAVKGAELLNMYVGESERALRNVFEKARAASPSIIFFDEIDTIAGRRDHRRDSGLHCLETLLNEMDGIETLRGVFVLAATNKPDVLDLALLRPGRFDSIVYVGPPNLSARVDILIANLGKMRDSVTVQQLAEEMEGHSGAEIVAICQKAKQRWFAETLAAGEEASQNGEEYIKRAMEEVPRQISPALRSKYENWKVGGDTGT